MSEQRQLTTDEVSRQIDAVHDAVKAEIPRGLSRSAFAERYTAALERHLSVWAAERRRRGDLSEIAITFLEQGCLDAYRAGWALAVAHQGNVSNDAKLETVARIVDHHLDRIVREGDHAD